MSTWKKVLLFIGLAGAATSTTLGALGASEGHDPIRLVDFLKIFAGGFLLGVTALGAIRGRRPCAPPPPPPPTITPKSGA